MKIPDNWYVIETGGGCTALFRRLANSELQWLITQIGDPSAPEHASDACVLGLYDDNDQVLLQWHCSCLAEALQIAEGAKML